MATRTRTRTRGRHDEGEDDDEDADGDESEEEGDGDDDDSDHGVGHDYGDGDDMSADEYGDDVGHDYGDDVGHDDDDDVGDDYVALLSPSTCVSRLLRWLATPPLSLPPRPPFPQSPPSFLPNASPLSSRTDVLVLVVV